MATLGLSTIAQLLFAEETTLDFARIVSELDAVLSRLREGQVTLVWDCDDLVIFDCPDIRIVLAWTEGRQHRFGGCLTVSVGPGLQTLDRGSQPEHEGLCSRLVERIQGRFHPVSVLWCQIEGDVDAEVVDEMMAALPELAGGLPPVDTILDALSRSDLHRAMAQGDTRRVKRLGPHRPPDASPEIGPEIGTDRDPGTTLAAANDQPDLPLPRDVELARLRMALYPPNDADAPAPPSTQMRLAVHCMNATLILVWAPLGAAVMTYSVLRGEDFRLSARMMAVTGTLLALAQSPVGQTMAAVAKSIG